MFPVSCVGGIWSTADRSFVHLYIFRQQSRHYAVSAWFLLPHYSFIVLLFQCVPALASWTIMIADVIPLFSYRRVDIAARKYHQQVRAAWEFLRVEQVLSRRQSPLVCEGARNEPGVYSAVVAVMQHSCIAARYRELTDALNPSIHHCDLVMDILIDAACRDVVDIATATPDTLSDRLTFLLTAGDASLELLAKGRK